jgi:NADH:ubiquinone oxidoreductase subunit 2 (subunit N)
MFFYKYMLFLSMYTSGNYFYLVCIILLNVVSFVYYFQILVDVLVIDQKNLQSKITYSTPQLEIPTSLIYLISIMLIIILIYGPLHLAAAYNLFLTVLLM